MRFSGEILRLTAEPGGCKILKERSMGPMAVKKSGSAIEQDYDR